MSAADTKLSPNKLAQIEASIMKSDVPQFRTGDTVRVHARIVEGAKERIQVFEGVVIKRNNGSGPSSTFTVRKVSANIGVERTFLVHSPRVEKIEIVAKGRVRRGRLFYLRPLRGKAARIRRRFLGKKEMNAIAGEGDATE